MHKGTRTKKKNGVGFLGFSHRRFRGCWWGRARPRPDAPHPSPSSGDCEKREGERGQTEREQRRESEREHQTLNPRRERERGGRTISPPMVASSVQEAPFFPALFPSLWIRRSSVYELIYISTLMQGSPPEKIILDHAHHVIPFLGKV